MGSCGLKPSLLAPFRGRLADKPDHLFINMTSQSVGYLKPFVDRIAFMRKVCRQAGVKYFGYHSIRHLSATMLYRDGNSVALIQQVLRHKNPNTTARYIKSLGLEEARGAMEATFGKLVSARAA